MLKNLLSNLYLRAKPYLTFDNLVAQLAHFGWGYFVPMKLWQHGLPLTYGVHIAAMIFLGKELIESLWGVWESKQSWTSFAIDYNFFVLGILATCHF